MSLERERALKENLSASSDNFAIEITKKDEMKQMKKKMAMLKEAILEERSKKNALNASLAATDEKLKKYEAENKKKQEKNEALMAEIRQLKDALIVERNEKQKCLEHLEGKLGSESGKQEGGSSKMGSSKFFGLRELFRK